MYLYEIVLYEFRGFNKENMLELQNGHQITIPCSRMTKLYSLELTDTLLHSESEITVSTTKEQQIKKCGIEYLAI